MEETDRSGGVERFPFGIFSSVLVFDVETTGLDSRSDTIIEFGGIKVTERGGGAQKTGEADLLISLPSGKHLSDPIIRLTGITPAMLRESGTDPRLAAETVSGLLSGPDTLLAAYNAQFDLCFLYYFLRQHRLEGCLRGVKMLDVMTVYKDRRPYPHKLRDAIESYRIQGQNTHRALDDAKATWALLCAMQAEADDLDRYVNLFGYHPGYGISGPRISSVTYRPQALCPGKKLYDSKP